MAQSQTASFRITAIALAAAAGLLLAGCSASPPDESMMTPGRASVSTSPSPHATSGTTATATPTYKPATNTSKAQNVPKPIMPAAAKAKTKEGLKAFTGYWFDLVNYANETGDIKPLKALTKDTCGSCTNLESIATTAHKEGGWYVGGKVSMTQFATDFEINTDGEYDAFFKLAQASGSTRMKTGKLNQIIHANEKVGPLEVALKYLPSGWYVVAMGRITGS